MKILNEFNPRVVIVLKRIPKISNMKINFQKIKNFNQILLSLAGIGILIFFLVLGAFLIMDAIDSRNYRNNRTPSGLIAQGETDQLLADSLRKQIVTFNSISIIDSAKQIFILPVTQATLKNGALNDELFNLVYGFSLSKTYKSNRNYDNTFNNIILFDALENKSEIVFSNRISIKDYDFYETDGIKYLIITGTDKDSNQDKYLNSNDLQKLFIYEIESKRLSEIALKENYSILATTYPAKTEIVFGKFGLDRNNDGKFDPRKEPRVFKRINLKDATLTNVIEEKQINRLQERLEGR